MDTICRADTGCISPPRSDSEEVADSDDSSDGESSLEAGATPSEDGVMGESNAIVEYESQEAIVQGGETDPAGAVIGGVQDAGTNPELDIPQLTSQGQMAQDLETIVQDAIEEAPEPLFHIGTSTTVHFASDSTSKLLIYTEDPVPNDNIPPFTLNENTYEPIVRITHIHKRIHWPTKDYLLDPTRNHLFRPPFSRVTFQIDPPKVPRNCPLPPNHESLSNMEQEMDTERTKKALYNGLALAAHLLDTMKPKATEVVLEIKGNEHAFCHGPGKQDWKREWRLVKLGACEGDCGYSDRIDDRGEPAKVASLSGGRIRAIRYSLSGFICCGSQPRSHAHARMISYVAFPLLKEGSPQSRS